MSCSKNVHINSGDCLVDFEDIIGDPSKNPQLVDFVEEKVKEGSGGSTEELEKKINAVDAKVDELKAEVDEKFENIDAYDVKYHKTTVGDVLDKIKDRKELSGTISEFPVYEKGRRLNDLELVWSFNKPLHTLQIICDPAYDGDEVIDVDPRKKSYVFQGITGDQKFTVVGKTKFEEECRLVSEIKFRLKYYWGGLADKHPENADIINLTNQFENFDDPHFSEMIGRHIINCEDAYETGGKYIYFFFPNHHGITYSFFTSGIKDTNFDEEVITVKNDYNYQAPYRMYRSKNKQTGEEIYVEVHVHGRY